MLRLESRVPLESALRLSRLTGLPTSDTSLLLRLEDTLMEESRLLSAPEDMPSLELTVNSRPRTELRLRHLLL